MAFGRTDFGLHGQPTGSDQSLPRWLDGRSRLEVGVQSDRDLPTSTPHRSWPPTRSRVKTWTDEEREDMSQCQLTGETYRVIGRHHGISAGACHHIIHDHRLRKERLLGDMTELIWNERLAIGALFPRIPLREITFKFLAEMWVNYPRLRLELRAIKHLGPVSVMRIGVRVFGKDVVEQYETAVEYADERYAQERLNGGQGSKKTRQAVVRQGRIILVDAAGKRVRRSRDQRF